MSFEFKSFEEIKNSIEEVTSVKTSAEYFCEIYEGFYRIILLISFMIFECIIIFQPGILHENFNKSDFDLIGHIFLFIYGNGLFCLLFTIVFGFFSTLINIHNMLSRISKHM